MRSVLTRPLRSLLSANGAGDRWLDQTPSNIYNLSDTTSANTRPDIRAAAAHMQARTNASGALPAVVSLKRVNSQRDKRHIHHEEELKIACNANRKWSSNAEATPTFADGVEISLLHGIEILIKCIHNLYISHGTGEKQGQKPKEAGLPCSLQPGVEVFPAPVEGGGG